MDPNSPNQDQINQVRAAAGFAPLQNNQPAQSLADKFGWNKPAPAPEPSFGERVANDWETRGNNALESVNQQAAGQHGTGKTALDFLGQGANFLNDVAGETLKSAYNSLPDFLKSHIDQSLQNFGQTVPGKAGVEGIKKTIESYANWSKEHPEASSALNDIGGIAGAALNAKGIAELPNLAEGALNSGKEAVQNVPGALNTVKSNVLEDVSGAKTALQNKAEQSVKDAWSKPATVNKPGFSKASEIFKNAESKGHDIAQTLADNKVTPSAHIDNKLYNTADTAEKMRTDAAKMSHELLRPSIEIADPMVQKTPVEDVVKDTIKNIENSKNVTPGDIKAQIENAKAEGAALKEKFPDGMKPSEIHDNRITYSQNGKYSPIGDPSTNNKAAVNRAFSEALNKTLEAKLPDGIPVKEFNAELSKQFQAADYLDALHGKKVPESLLSKIAQTGAKVAGAVAGKGGGLLGEVGGYHLGGMVESLISKIPGNIRDNLLLNLEKTNPEVFDKVSQFLSEETKNRASRLALPAPKELGTTENPIIGKMPESSGVKAVPAKRLLPQRNPTTGRMQRVYSSQP